MSINHFSSSQELSPDATWCIMDPNPHAHASSNSKQHKVGSNPWTFHHQDPHSHVWLNSQQSASMLLSPNPTRNFNLSSDHNHDEADNMNTAGSQELSVDKEPMFEKPLTPSDVGKLNRLVIPKQHAEKYFPLGGDAGDKGLLLGFEDESGKSWRFRYSYWNSSQSYVLTKGWSRYVKEKQLDAGDAVLFERHRTDCERFFIGWRRRNAAAKDSSVPAAAQHSGGGAGDEWTRGFYPAQPYPAHHGPPHPAPYQPDCTRAGSGGSHIVPTIVPAGNMKRLRLFGVNLECQTDDSSEPSTPDGSSSLSNHGAPNYNNQQHQQHYYYSSQAYSSSDHHNYVQYQTN